MGISFVPLRLRSRYSYLTGTMRACEIPSYLRESGFTAGALLDAGNLSGAIEFYEKALDEGVKPILGAEITCPSTGVRIGLIAFTREGYANLCRLVSEINIDQTRDLGEAIAEGPGGLGALCVNMDYALRLAGILDRDRVWLEIIANLEADSSVRAKLEGARRSGLRCLASWDVLIRDPREDRIARVLEAIRTASLFSETDRKVRHVSLRDSLSLTQMFHARPELLRESKRLADMVDTRLEIGKPHFPHARPSPEESFACLQRMCIKALSRGHLSGKQTARRRLHRELRIIQKLGLADYFLVVCEIVHFAADSGIPVAGRGSGAGSLVAYLLGITQVDPIAEHLLFERFLNEYRPDYPDLDIDISWKRRDEIIDFVYRRHGKDRVAMISTHACFEIRSAVREVAKAFGLSPYEAQSVAAALPHTNDRMLPSRLERVLGEIKPQLSRGCRRTIGELATSIVGFPHHMSVHCGGIVISDRPITYYTPLEVAPKGIQVTQFDMRSIEKIGLIKIDLLGNRALSVIEEATDEIEKAHSTGLDIPTHDGRTADVLRRGHTLSCFQLESPAMRSLLAMMRATTRADATLALALVRPGPSAGGMKERFIRKRLARGVDIGQSADSHGGGVNDFPVYEEDVMRLIDRYTGAGLAEADILRRLLNQAGPGDESLKDRFVFLAGTVGLSRTVALEAWETISRFAAYTFCKAHACSYGMMAYAAAYLKANFPLEFYAATLRNHSGMYPVWVHVNEARRNGVRILLPSVNCSERDFSIEAGTIRTGLNSIKHLSEATIGRIMAERKRCRFTSFSDFVARVRADKDEIMTMVSAGAFDEIEPDRCGALAQCVASKGKSDWAVSLPLGLPEAGRSLPTREFTAIRKREMEYAMLGFSPLVHPLELFRDGKQSQRDGRLVRSRGSVSGLLAATRYYKANGRGLHFLSLDNPGGMREGLLPRDAASQRLEIGQAYCCRGNLRHRFGVPALSIHAIERLEKKGA